MNMDYTFTLKYKLPAHESDMDALVERLGAQACTDATVGIGKAGRLALDFVRSGQTAEAALRSAIVDVHRAIPAAQLVEAGPDFVGLSEIAAFVGVTRQNLHKLTQAHWSSFPPPIHEGSAPTWHLAEVLVWLREEQNYQLGQAPIDIAKACQALNSMNQLFRQQSGNRQDARVSAMALVQTNRPFSEFVEFLVLGAGSKAARKGKVINAAQA